MIDEILNYSWVLGLFLFFWACGTFLMHCTGKGKLNKLIRRFAFVGVYFHEFSHYLFAKIVHVKVESFNVSKDDEGVYGQVSVSGEVNFLQGLLIGIAPFVVAVYVCYLMIVYLYSPFFDFYVGILLLVLSVSLVIGSVPSFQDWRVVGISIRGAPAFALYQVLLLFFIFYLQQILIPEGIIIFFFEPLNSILIIGGFYYFIRYSMKGFIILFSSVKTHYRYNSINHTNKKGYKKSFKYRTGFIGFRMTSIRFSREYHKNSNTQKKNNPIPIAQW